MDIFNDLLNFSELELAAQLAIAVQTTLILFFIVSPIVGFLMARAVKSRINAVLAGSIAVLVGLLLNIGLNVVLRGIIPLEAMSDAVIATLSFLTAWSTAVLVARYIGWYLADPARPQWAIEQENLTEDEMMPFDKRRKEWMERRKRAQKR